MYWEQKALDNSQPHESSKKSAARDRINNSFQLTYRIIHISLDVFYKLSMFGERKANIYLSSIRISTWALIKFSSSFSPVILTAMNWIHKFHLRMSWTSDISSQQTEIHWALRPQVFQAVGFLLLLPLLFPCTKIGPTLHLHRRRRISHTHTVYKNPTLNGLQKKINR